MVKKWDGLSVKGIKYKRRDEQQTNGDEMQTKLLPPRKLFKLFR